MVQLFRDRMHRDGSGLGALKVWLAMIVDLATSALKEHSNGGSMTSRAWNGMENAIYTPEGYTDRIQQELGNCLTETNIPQGEKFTGKVRDRYDLGDRMVLITTDRQSAFDRVLAAIPFKGQVLNMTSAWWFEQTRHIVPNQVLDVPDPNVTVARKCTVFPIEFVVRGYITGTTSTSLWTVYQSGARQYCGIDLARRPGEKPEARDELPHTDHQGGGPRPPDQP